MTDNPTPHFVLDGRVLVVGANHRSSSMILRDRLFVEDTDAPFILERLKNAGIEQALVLSTCDRVEVQAFCKAPATDDEQTARLIIEILAEHGELGPAEMDGQTYVHWDQEAVRQIFAVTSSLDSLIIGEPQVLGQVKAAHRIAKQAGMTSGGLESILQAAYSTAKRVRNETGIGERPVSIAAAATQLAGDLHGDLDRCTVVLVGGGEMGELIAYDMMAAGLSKLVATHPTERRAEEAARRLDCHTRPFEDLATLLAEADIVLTALGRRRQAITASMVENAISTRRHKPIFLIDTAIPGDIDPLVERIEDAFLYSLDDLERVAMEGRAGRENESGAAWKIIDADVDVFVRGHVERTAVPALSRLRSHFEGVREQALADGGGDAEKATRLLVNRLLHGPSEQLRQVAVDGANSGSLQDIEEIIDRLFSLEDDEEN
ncbi:MAG: glutamyl-tRNA reductase [Rhodospirillaceae bacterium]|nr:glutamyl-tRNA reductase [Rhodospirillaceae bacterium]MBL6930613.1 glutamyl-tRNA reductase [Rhodospirillales bacterium]MBL6941196.1 glutamyl-tRNA reductase [Rhodospirillales bacterium]